MVQDIPGLRDPSGPRSGTENGSAAPQVDDERFSSDSKGSLHCVSVWPFHDCVFFKPASRAAMNRRFSFVVLMATRIICVVRPGNVEQSRTRRFCEASRSVTSPAQVHAGSSINTKFAAEGYARMPDRQWSPRRNRERSCFINVRLRTTYA